jgi:hypothetical protein
MNNFAFIVEGDLEKNFIQSVCPNKVVVKIGCNGDKVAISEIGKRVASQARLLQKRHQLIIVIFDREERTESVNQLNKALRCYLENQDVQVLLAIGIADREIENWILADYEAFAISAGLNIKNVESKDFEGKCGKAIVKRLIKGRISYHEKIHGAEWLKKCDSSKIRANSQSFRSLCSELEMLNCWWLNRNNLEYQS